jgi:hypothetical protein
MAKRGAPIGNKNATKNKSWSDAIRKAIVRRKDMDKLAGKLVDLALEGNMPAMREIGDRLQGRPAQTVTTPQDQRFRIIVR